MESTHFHKDMELIFTIILAAIPIILFLLGWVLKQNRDARIQMGTAISTLTEAVQNVRDELHLYRETWIDRREALIEIITNHCTQSQGACRALVELQMDTLKEKQDTVCQKIDDLKAQRDKQWEKQKERNKEFRSHMNNSNIHTKP